MRFEVAAGSTLSRLLSGRVDVSRCARFPRLAADRGCAMLFCDALKVPDHASQIHGDSICRKAQTRRRKIIDSIANPDFVQKKGCVRPSKWDPPTDPSAMGRDWVSNWESRAFDLRAGIYRSCPRLGATRAGLIGLNAKGAHVPPASRWLPLPRSKISPTPDEGRCLCLAKGKCLVVRRSTISVC